MKKGKQLVALVCAASLLCSLAVGCTGITETTAPGSTTHPTTAPTSGTQSTTVPPTTVPPTTVPPTTVPPVTEPLVTEPPTQPTEPPTQPTEPPTQPTEPPTQPTEPPTEPTEPPTEPTEPPTEPTEPLPTDPPSEDYSESTMTKEERLAMYQKIATEEAAWLASLQIENGARLMTCGPNGNFTMNPYFADFAALYAALPLDRCGYLPEEVPTASPEDMTVYYSAEKQARYGVVGIEISLIEEEST